MVHANQCAQICSVQKQENCQPGHVEKWNAIQEGQVAMNSINGKGNNDPREWKSRERKVTIDLFSLFYPEGALEFIFNAPCLN